MNEKKKILIVEDERHLADAISEIVKREKFILNIVEVVNNTMLKCIPDTGIDGDVSGISGIIASNFKRMTFKLINPLFEEHNITKESFALSEIRGVDEVYDSIKLFNPSSYVKIPLNIGNDFAVNSLQEDILKNIFAKEETKKCPGNSRTGSVV